MSTSQYPGALDQLTNPTGSQLQSQLPHSGQHAAVNDAVEAVQAVLGTMPQGNAPTVDGRLDNIEVSVGSAQTSISGLADAVAQLQQSGPSTVTGTFLISGNRVGPLALGDLIHGGINIDYAMTFGSAVFHLDQHPEGTDAILEVFVQVRATGITTSAGTATFTKGQGRRAALTFASALSVNPGDRILIVCNQLGSNRPGSDLVFSFRGTDATVPGVLGRPAAPTAITAVVTNTTDIALSWTAAASGVVAGYQLYRDGVLITTLAGQATHTFTDPGIADQGHTYSIYSINDDQASPSGTGSYTPATGITVRTPCADGVVNAQSTTLVLNVNRDVAAGDRVIVVLGAGQSSGQSANVTWTCADSKGNAYSVDYAPVYVASPLYQTGVFSARVTTALTAGDQITLTVSLAILKGAARAFSVAGLLTSPLDISVGGANSTSSRTLNSTTTAALAQAAELVVAVWATAPTTTTAGGSYTAGQSNVSTAGTGDKQVNFEYLLTSATTAQSPTMTIPTTATASASTYAVVSYKGA